MLISKLCDVSSRIMLPLSFQKGNDRPIIQSKIEDNISRFPSIFFSLSGFSILLVTTYLLRGLFT